jgi:hypothetical protein
MPAQQRQRNNSKDASVMLAMMPVQRGGIQEPNEGKVAQFQLGVLGELGRRQQCTFSMKVILL